MKLDPESALRSANAKFRRRFAAMETVAGGREGLDALSSAQLEELWSRAKHQEKSSHTSQEEEKG